MTTKRYSELISIPTFEERFEYLKLNGIVGAETFGSRRYLNQILYKTDIWKQTRRKIILRDDGYDLAHPDYAIRGMILIHHINPITIDDILEKRYNVFDPENLISTSLNTHNAIHYGDKDLLIDNHLVIRQKNDTCLWR